MHTEKETNVYRLELQLTTELTLLTVRRKTLQGIFTWRNYHVLLHVVLIHTSTPYGYARLTLSARHETGNVIETS